MLHAHWRTPPGFDPCHAEYRGLSPPAIHGEPRWGSASYAASPLHRPPLRQVPQPGTGNKEQGTSLTSRKMTAHRSAKPPTGNREPGTGNISHFSPPTAPPSPPNGEPGTRNREHLSLLTAHRSAKPPLTGNRERGTGNISHFSPPNAPPSPQRGTGNQEPGTSLTSHRPTLRQAPNGEQGTRNLFSPLLTERLAPLAAQRSSPPTKPEPQRGSPSIAGV